MPEEEQKDSLEETAEALGEAIGKGIRKGARILDAIAKGIEKELESTDKPHRDVPKKETAMKPPEEPTVVPVEDKPA
jgi:hypothetical protein